MTFIEANASNTRTNVIDMFDHRDAREVGTQSQRQFQTTLAQSVSFTGVGVHSGQMASLYIHPAAVGTGLVFAQTIGGTVEYMPAHAHNVIATDMATVLGNSAGMKVSTIEHVMSALRGLGIDNAILELQGIEVPILDGSAAEFVAAIQAAGIEIQSATRKFLRVLKPVVIDNGAQRAELWPDAGGFRIEAEIDFPSAVIGYQSLWHTVDANSFATDIAPARTFGFVKDLEKVQAMGFALGTSLANTVAVSDEGVMNPEGLRFADEFVRHKILDAVGDLALAGLPILGLYRVKRANHKINSDIVKALLANTSAWDIVEAGSSTAAVEPRLAYAE